MRFASLHAADGYDADKKRPAPELFAAAMRAPADTACLKIGQKRLLPDYITQCCMPCVAGTCTPSALVANRYFIGVPKMRSRDLTSRFRFMLTLFTLCGELSA